MRLPLNSTVVPFTDSILEAPMRKKKKTTSTNTAYQGLKDKLTDRVECSREIRKKVVEMSKAVETPHIAYANYFSSKHLAIHADL